MNRYDTRLLNHAMLESRNVCLSKRLSYLSNGFYLAKNCGLANWAVFLVKVSKDRMALREPYLRDLIDSERNCPFFLRL